MTLTRKGALALVLLGAGCQKNPETKQVPMLVQDGPKVSIPEGSPLRLRLVVDSVRTQLVRSRLTTAATVEADPSRLVRILLPMAGRVLSLRVRLGDVVARDQPLLTLDSPDFTAAFGDYAHTRSAFAQADNSLKRQRDLAVAGIAAKRDVDQAETDYTLAKGELQRARARLTSLGVNPDAATRQPSLVVRSPIRGKVIELSVGEGEFHNDATIPLMSVADLNTVWLTASVQERDIRHVARGQFVTAVVTAYPGDTVRGRVLAVGDLLDPDTRSAKVRVALPNNAGRLKPGMFGTVVFEGTPERAVTVPATAVLQLGDTSFVYVETKPWAFERRAILLGEPFGSRVVVTAGLQGGQRIVARQAVLLQ
jgi:cobalt-zinc-cadmium efflux system membrane fusion protein